MKATAAGVNSSALNSKPEQLYDLLCKLVVEKHDPVDWSSLDPAWWGYLERLALEHGVAPLVYRRFKSTGWPAEAPRSFQSALAEAYFQGTAQNAALFSELNLVANALVEAGIPAVLLKGAHLALALYPDIALRPMHDLDLLVAETDVDRALNALGEIGYSLPLPVISQGLNRELGHHIYLSRAQSSLPGVELHWRLLGGSDDRRSAPADWFWAHAEPLQLAGAGKLSGALALDATANLLFLAAHLYLAHFGDSGRLIWLYDIHRLLESWGERIDWQAAEQAAGEFGWTEALYRALRAAQEDLGTQLPEGVLDRLASTRPELLRQPRRRDAAPRYPARATLDSIANYSPRARFRIWLAVIFPSPEHIRWRYHPRPAWLWPLYYPVKWAGMARGGLRVLREGAAGRFRDEQ